jgi:hypothetical protein
MKYLPLIGLVACSGGLASVTVTKIHDAQQECEFIYERSDSGRDRAESRGCICDLQSALSDYDAGPFVGTQINCKPGIQ